MSYWRTGTANSGPTLSQMSSPLDRTVSKKTGRFFWSTACENVSSCSSHPHQLQFNSMAYILVSACLLGKPVGYNGSDALCSDALLQRWVGEGRVCRFGVSAS